MSHHVIDHVVINRSFGCSMQHQIRWMKSTRCSRSAGHAGTGLTFAMPFGVMALAASGVLHLWTIGMGLLAAAYLNRVALSLVAGWGVVRDKESVRLAWLYPLRDLMGFVFWCASYGGRRIIWRGEWYRLADCGRMVSESPAGSLVPTLIETEPAAASAVADRFS
jgi:ceramide glucosyltransferase